MESIVARLDEIVKQHSIEISQLFNIISKLNGQYIQAELKANNVKNEMETIHDKLDTIIIMQKHTNGTVSLHTKLLIIVGTAITVLLVTNGSSLAQFALALIK